MTESKDLANTMKVRAATSMEHEEEGKILLVNQGKEKVDMDAWYFNVDMDEMKLDQYSQREVLTEVMQINRNKMRKMQRELGENMYDPDLRDAPEWIQGIINEEDFEEHFKLEYEYVLGKTAIARRFTGENGENREEWVLTYQEDGDALTLTAKLESEDRFPDEEWEIKALGSGNMVKEVQKHEDLPDMEVTKLDDFAFEEKGEIGQGIDEERIRQAIKGVIGKICEEGDTFSYKVERVEDASLFRIVIDDELYYYWFETASYLNMPFKIPDWAIMIADADGIINLEI